MLRNYIKITFRNLWKNKTFSFINILGLALGMACSLLILLWVKDEWGVDAFHANNKQLFRIFERKYRSNGTVEGEVWTPAPLANEMKKVIPEVQMAVTYGWTYSQTFAVGNKVYKQAGNTVGSDFFKMFSFKLLEGTPETALKDINGIAVSRKMAALYFGTPQAAMGKTIRFDNRKDLLVTAVFEDLPQNSTLQFDCLRSYDAFVEDNTWAKAWDSDDPLTFIMLRPDADPVKVSAKITHFLENYRKSNNILRSELDMQPFHEYYLHSNFKNGYVDGGRIEYVQLFSLVAVFILLIACINFMNLSTARSAKRAKEVGIRKVVGAVKSALVRQFVGEALLLTIFSVVLSVVLVATLLPAFNNLTGKQMILPVNEFSFWGIIMGLTLLTGLLAGSYPAFFLSSLNPIRVLKGTLKFDSSSTWLRQGLVVFQFVLSIMLIVGVIVINRQVDYIQNKNLGYNRENFIYIPLEGELGKNYALFKEKAALIPSVKQFSRMTQTPTDISWGTLGIKWEGQDQGLLSVRFAPAGVGYDFVKTMNLKLAEGRDFSKDFATDSSNFIINEAALKLMGFKNPLEKTLTWGKRTGKIVGVLKDFHFQSLHETIRPLIVTLREKSGGEDQQDNALIRVEAGQTQRALADLEKICKELNPKFPFTYQFSDQEYAKLYQSEQSVSKLSNYFAFLAIFISCLGLLGLAAFTAEQRTKEIGIRKVLGASVPNIIGLLSKEFIKMVAIAAVIAFPLAWWAMTKWLQGFAYQISIEWWYFLVAGFSAGIIALLTVGYQAIKAALMNPVKSLKTE